MLPSAALDKLAARSNACRAATETNIGGWSIEILHAAERIASDTVQEVAAWSVLYSEEVPDPSSAGATQPRRVHGGIYAWRMLAYAQTWARSDPHR